MKMDRLASCLRFFGPLIAKFVSKKAKHIFCTYFDIRYLDKGLSLYASLQKQIGDLELWILCLDSEVREKLHALALPGIRTLSVDDLEDADPALRACRNNRRLVEYYFTTTPCLISYLLRRTSHSTWVTYLDSDLFFFGSPAPIFEEMNGGDVAIIPHRFPENQRQLEIYGKYNVGWVSFRKSRAGIRCAKWWRQRCMEWCRDVPEDGKFADQKYLDHFHAVTNRLVIIAHPGANLAPWNLASHTISQGKNCIEVDGKALIFYHFHDCKPAGERTFDPGLFKFGHPMPPLVRNEIYLPYLRLLMEKRCIGGTSTMRFDGTGIEPGKSPKENLITVPID